MWGSELRTSLVFRAMIHQVPLYLVSLNVCLFICGKRLMFFHWIGEHIERKHSADNLLIILTSGVPSANRIDLPALTLHFLTQSVLDVKPLVPYLSKIMPIV